MTPWIAKPVPFNIGQGAAAAGATPPTELFDENYEDATPWSFVNTQWTVDAGGNGLLLGTNVPDNVNSQASRSMGFSMPAKFTWKIEFKCTSSTNNQYDCWVTYNTAFINSQLRGIGLHGNGATQMALCSLTGGNMSFSSWNTSLVQNTQYYLKIVNDDSNVTLDIFTGSDYATGQVGSTVSVTDPNLTDLSILQHCGRADGGGGTTSLEINNVSVFEP